MSELRLNLVGLQHSVTSTQPQNKRKTSYQHKMRLMDTPTTVVGDSKGDPYCSVISPFKMKNDIYQEEFKCIKERIEGQRDDLEIMVQQIEAFSFEDQTLSDKITQIVQVLRSIFQSEFVTEVVNASCSEWQLKQATQSLSDYELEIQDLKKKLSQFQAQEQLFDYGF